MSIDVLEEIQKLNKENSDNNKIKLGFEEETNEKSSPWITELIIRKRMKMIESK